MHILLVDDSSSTRSLLRTLINSGQAVRHEISEASSGEEALQKVGTGVIKMPDIIIADINMGGMNGYEVCREFRQRYGGVSDIVPYIITVTANEGIEVINKVLDAGANDYMPKPVNVKILQIRLRFAERLLAQGRSLGGGGGGNGDPRQALIASTIEQTDAPVVVVEVGEAPASFKVIYSNVAMTTITQHTQAQLLGKSLAELESWTPEFLQTVLAAVAQGAGLSHVSLGTAVEQDVPVYLSFYPVRSGDEPVTHYLVIHHL
jgi:CheY-like chemotaxis protein